MPPVTFDFDTLATIAMDFLRRVTWSMKRVLTSMVVLAMTLGLGGCSTVYKWHQKLTVVVSTPAGDVSGSSVSEVAIQHPQRIENPLANVARVSAMRGEAVVVEVAPGKYLFALIDEAQQLLAFKVFDNDVVNPTEDMSKAMVAPRGPAEVDPKYYPPLVTFDDINDPKSAKLVEPGKLDEVFGAGYSLKSVSLAVTDELVNTGRVFKMAPWSKQLTGSIGKDMRLPYDHLLNQINDGSFHRGS